MGKAPAVIIIARHGARLDAENKSWHLTSPTPYDPPLSYGGWTQTRALGARIGSLLHARNAGLNDGEGSEIRKSSAETSVEAARPKIKEDVKRRKHRVIIHTSPFLRCLQSSIGVSAGMSQFAGNLAQLDFQEQQASSKSSKLFSDLSRPKTLETSTVESKYAPNIRPITPPTTQTGIPAEESLEFPKPLLRVDACLGEWLTPDYYENMTHPPASNMMIAGAKAELLRATPPIKGSQLHDEPSPAKSHATDRRPHESTITFALDKSNRPLSGLGPSGNKRRNLQRSLVQKYTPPTPNYAVSPSEAIPDGYVGHARDACIDVDFQWDSMRSPQHWGDGGQFGEEWSSMHNRFRKGLMDMITWYKENGHQQGLRSTSEENAESHVTEDDEDDSDLVLILITHSAGCNALIGALTNQPVLIDVGMASLTMATLKDSSSTDHRSGPPRPRAERRQSVVDCSQSDEYEMKVVASTDHLRAGSDVLKIPQLQSTNPMPAMVEQTRQRGSSLSVVTTPLDLDRPRSKNSSLGSIRRIRPTATTPANKFPGTPDITSPSGTGGGLWGGRRSSTQLVQDSELDPLTPEMNPPEWPGPASLENLEKERNTPVSMDRPSLTSIVGSQESIDRRNSRGLWGGGVAQEPKRRWTISDKT